MKTDKELADEVRRLANNLCVAMNAAGDAGLLQSVEVKPHYHSNASNGDKKAEDWKPYVAIWRTTHA